MISGDTGLLEFKTNQNVQLETEGNYCSSSDINRVDVSDYRVTVRKRTKNKQNFD